MRAKILTIFVLLFFSFCGNVFSCDAEASSYSYKNFTRVFSETVTCKYCGRSAANAKALRSLGPCPNSPSKKHVALRGRKERQSYVCRYCGFRAPTLRILSAGACRSNPNGKRHVAAD